MKPFLPRSLRATIILMVAVGLVVLALSGYFSSPTNWVSQPVVAIQTWVSSRYFAVRDFLTIPRDVASLRQRNAELEAEVAGLQRQVIELQQQVTETEMLSALLDFARANPEYEYKGAHVIGRDPSPFLRYIIINLGSNAGIRRGMAVVTHQGLVGRVDAVIAEAARVQLITDPTSTVDVYLQNAKTEALLVGSITGNISLDMISQDITVNVGDVVLTSGLGGGYPPNLLVGQVLSIRQRAYELYQQADLQPIVDFSQLELVMVITNFKPVDITPLVPTLEP